MNIRLSVDEDALDKDLIRALLLKLIALKSAEEMKAQVEFLSAWG